MKIVVCKRIVVTFSFFQYAFFDICSAAACVGSFAMFAVYCAGLLVSFEVFCALSFELFAFVSVCLIVCCYFTSALFLFFLFLCCCCCFVALACFGGVCAFV